MITESMRLVTRDDALQWARSLAAGYYGLDAGDVERLAKFLWREYPGEYWLDVKIDLCRIGAWDDVWAYMERLDSGLIDPVHGQ